MEIEMTVWDREDWRNAGFAYRWYCSTCRRYGPFEVRYLSTVKAEAEHRATCKAA